MAHFNDQETLFEAVAHGDPEAREQAIVDHMPLVHALVRRHQRPGEGSEDLAQVGMVALIGAVDRFDPHRGASFSSFAVPTIAGEMRRHFRDHAGAMRLPRSLSEARHRVAAAVDQVRADAGHEPSVAELGEEAGMERADVREALSADGVVRTVPYWGEDGLAAHERVGSDEAGFATAEMRADLTDAMHDLPARERVIIHLRFSEDMTQDEIADVVGISQMHVSRLLRDTLARMGDAVGTA